LIGFILLYIKEKCNYYEFNHSAVNSTHDISSTHCVATYEHFSHAFSTGNFQLDAISTLRNIDFRGHLTATQVDVMHWLCALGCLLS
jgi:hypothetical protein